jgi:hypothetical protein
MSEHFAWKRGFGEGAVILVSILLAFFVDAWWDRRQALALEFEVLSAVVEEFEANRLELRRIIATNELDLVLVDRLLRSNPSDLMRVAPDSVAAYVRALPRIMTFNPIHGASASFVQSPALTSEGIRSRARVSMALRALADATEEHARINRLSDMVRGKLAPYAASSRGEGLDRVPRMVARLGPNVLSRIASDGDLIAAIVDKSHIRQLYTDELRVALGLMDSVSDEVAAELRAR